MVHTSVSQIDTLRDSLVGGLLKRGEDDRDPALLGLDEMCGISEWSNTLLLLSKSGVAELRRKDAKLASSPPPKALCEFPTWELLPFTAVVTCVLGAAFRKPESFLTKTLSLLLWEALEWRFPLSWLLEANTLLCFPKLDPLSLFLVTWPLLPLGWLTDLKQKIICSIQTWFHSHIKDDYSYCQQQTQRGQGKLL